MTYLMEKQKREELTAKRKAEEAAAVEKINSEIASANASSGEPVVMAGSRERVLGDMF
jgi:hypothetical protein